MSSLAHDRYPVKPPRKTPRRPGDFGSGLMRSVPHYGPEIATTSDERWAAQHFADQRAIEEARRSQRAADEAETVKRLSEGWRF